MKVGSIELEGKDYPIRLGNLAFSIVEEKMNVENAFAMLQGKKLRSARLVQCLVYGGIKTASVLREEECPLSFEMVGAMIDPTKFDDYLATCLGTLEIKANGQEKKTKVKASS